MVSHPIRLKDGVIALPYDNPSLLISRDNVRDNLAQPQPHGLGRKIRKWSTRPACF